MRLFKACLSEFIGTFALVFAGCGAVAANQVYGGVLGQVGISLTFGLVIMVMIYAVGHIGGAHFNPAVTIAFCTSRHFPAKYILPYIVSQCVGAILAAYVLYLTFQPLAAKAAGVVLSLGVTQPAGGSLLLALSWEFMLTFMLMFVIMAVATDSRAVGSAAGLAVGGTVCLASLFGGPVTGASMNPARSLGPALVMGEWGLFYAYVIGPVLGAVAAGFTYNFIKNTGAGSPEAD